MVRPTRYVFEEIIYRGDERCSLVKEGNDRDPPPDASWMKPSCLSSCNQELLFLTVPFGSKLLHTAVIFVIKSGTGDNLRK